MIQNQKENQGAVSLFIVMFTSVLLLIVTIGFIRLMIGDQQQATLNDVSQSAYDSAMAGVEDAKRMLLIYQACENGEKTDAQCAVVKNAMNNPSCSMLSVIDNRSVQYNQEKLIQQKQGTSGEVELSQAYTCVKILSSLTNYLGGLNRYESVVIPIKPTEKFTSIRISWFNIEDIKPKDRANVCMSYPQSSGLPVEARWKQDSCPSVNGTSNINTPALMRVMLAQVPDSGGDLESFNTADGANTVFLYPSETGVNTYPMAIADRKSPSIGTYSPQDVGCQPSLSVGGYACHMDIIPSNTNLNNTNYLHLTALYADSHYKVELIEGDKATPISSPQIEIDSTGRANNLFRRVLARVELSGKVTYPTNALSVGDSICKDFIVSKTLYRDDADGVCN